MDQKCLILLFLGWNLKSILSYLKSAPSNLSNNNIFRKSESTYTWDKNALFGYFCERIWKKKLFSLLKSAPSNLPISKTSRKKKKMSKFGTKNAWFGYFWAGIWKIYCHTWNQHPPICLMAIFSEKAKKPKLGTKMPYLGIFVKEFEKKTIFLFEINTFKFVDLQNFMKKQKCLNFRPKMPDLGIFDLELANNIVISKISTSNKNA